MWPPASSCPTRAQRTEVPRFAVRLRIVFAAAAAVAICGCGPASAPGPGTALREPAHARRPGEFSVATYNLAWYAPDDRDGDGQRNDPKPAVERDAVASLLARIDADVLAVQEIGQGAMAKDLRRKLRARGLDYPYLEHAIRPQSDRARPGSSTCALKTPWAMRGPIGGAESTSTAASITCSPVPAWRGSSSGTGRAPCATPRLRSPRTTAPWSRSSKPTTPTRRHRAGRIRQGQPSRCARPGEPRNHDR